MSDRAEFVRNRLTILTVVCWLLFFVSLATGWVFFTYVFLIAGSASTCWAVHHRLTDKYKPFAKWIGVAATCIAVCWWGSVDTYEKEWVGEYGTEFTDTYRRWGSELIYRRAEFKSDESALMRDSAYGPMTASGKQHGEWVYFTWKPLKSETRWYWYGEEISEGEWHLRNK